MKQTPPTRRTPLKSRSAITKRLDRGEPLKGPELAKACLVLWSRLVKLHAHGLCEWCGQPAVHAHHMRAKAQGNKLKYALENGVALCYGCHVEFHQKDSLKGWLLFEQQRPGSYEFVRNSTHEPMPLKTADLRALLNDLSEQIKAFGEAA